MKLIKTPSSKSLIKESVFDRCASGLLGYSMDLNLIPYALLAIAIVTGWRLARPTVVGIFIVAVFCGLFFERLRPVSLIWMAIYWLSISLAVKESLHVWRRWLGTVVFLVLSIGLSNHILPGFNNLPVFEKVQFSSDSAPFSMYLNFDKTLVGIFIYLFFLKSDLAIFRKQDGVLALKTLAALVAIIIPLALAVGYVRFDPKFPPLGWLWILNNFLFVCLAEEGLFRGVIQGGLEKLLPQSLRWSWVALIVAALFFGMAHYKGGTTYVLFAAFAGLFYGYVFMKTKRLELSMTVHFGLNLMHFLLFSYPSLMIG